ncbi:hypothetical protein IV38_GL002136 [Lactobacillus selangorensis]|uniref:Uncharacterized protein n=1 Tax=Lactobacillus selangorensis TaxID=81857 RepID=A0A0R2FS73_9LACO|nr:hypothetical protein [Lactobacillus selangorensis]KRN27482.1 hypothetical protein IV38_GL002136 [Lactobacillus selangorensis]KRN31321.1 hypothetical protein IV40_GL001314 [Lactobacillus selangorensis]
MAKSNVTTKKGQTFTLIQQIKRLDGSTYYELGNVMLNGRAELAANRGYITAVRILQLNIPHSRSVIIYEDYINDTYTMPTAQLDHWEEWDKPEGKIRDAYHEILKENHIG